MAAPVLVASCVNGSSATVVRGRAAFRKGSIFEQSQVPFSTLLPAIKSPELNLPVREDARQLGLADNTVYRLHHPLRAGMVVSRSFCKIAEP